MHEKNVWIFLDGDQKRAESKPSSEIADNKVDVTISGLVGARTIIFGADGGSDKDSAKRLTEQKRKYIDYVHGHVRFLPRSCPEEIVLKSIDPTAAPASSDEAKTQLRQELEGLGLTPSSSDSDAQAQVLLAQHQNGNEDLKTISALLREMLTSASSGAAK